MNENLEKLAKHVKSKLRLLGDAQPSPVVIREILHIAYLASLKTEEARFIQGSITYADPSCPDTNPPILRRADYPTFTKFRRRRHFTVDNFVKLSRAISNWTGSLTIFGKIMGDLYIWGVVDQLFQHNVLLYHESSTGFSSPGIFRIHIDGVGALSVYRGSLLLGALRQDKIVTHENDALKSEILSKRIIPEFLSKAIHISYALGEPNRSPELLHKLYDCWCDEISRICIGLRRMGTGGSLLITPKPVSTMLEINHQFPYRRLGDAITLKVLDDEYNAQVKNIMLKKMRSNILPKSIVISAHHAETDANDRIEELTGAVKLITSLATADGLVLMTPSLTVIGFGAKIGSGKHVRIVYDGSSIIRERLKWKLIDVSKFGTRHSSMLRYCYADRNAVGIVISQDGQVRLIMSKGRSLVMWENVKLLRQQSDARKYAKNENRVRTYRNKQRNEVSLGYTDMPKTVQSLLAVKTGS